MANSQNVLCFTNSFSGLSFRHFEIINRRTIIEPRFRLTAEIQDIFKGPVFAQIFFSCIIICTTCFIIADQPTNISILVGFVSYLLTMITQILLFCWIGNEVIYSVSSENLRSCQCKHNPSQSYRLTERAYFSNFIEFDKPTARVLLIFMQRSGHGSWKFNLSHLDLTNRTVKDITVKAGGLFDVTLSLMTFMSVKTLINCIDQCLFSINCRSWSRLTPTSLFFKAWKMTSERFANAWSIMTKL